MSKLELLETVEVGTRASLIAVPAHFCMETGGEISTYDAWQSNAAIKIGDVVVVYEAP